MLLGGKGGCQQCTCVPCDACTRTCQNPYTGTEFEAVFTRYFEGAETGNVSDGYLTATGDSDTSDPYDGMDGTGPWFQQITGGFTLNSTQTRFPCRVLVSFWRNNYTLGAATIPPASTALTSNKVYLTVSDGAVIVGDRVIVPADGEVHIDGLSIPLVTGGGDQSGNIPRFYEGSVYVAPQCESASFSIRARIEWNTQKRQHVLYGLVRECYQEDGELCEMWCDGNPANDTIYLTISNYGGPSPNAFVFNGTYVLERFGNYCNAYRAVIESDCVGGFGVNEAFVATETNSQFIKTGALYGGVCASFYLTLPLVTNTRGLCGTGVLHSGTIASSTGGTAKIYDPSVQFPSWVATSNCFDWEITA